MSSDNQGSIAWSHVGKVSHSEPQPYASDGLAIFRELNHFHLQSGINGVTWA